MKNSKFSVLEKCQLEQTKIGDFVMLKDLIDFLKYKLVCMSHCKKCDECPYCYDGQIICSFGP